MKHIPLKMVVVEIEGKPTRLSYKAQIVELIRHPVNGANYEDVRHSIRLLDALEGADNTLELEDSDFEFLKQRVLSTRWPYVDRYVLTFIEDVTGDRT
jgi:hypothetical protein